MYNSIIICTRTCTVNIASYNINITVPFIFQTTDHLSLSSGSSGQTTSILVSSSSSLLPRMLHSSAVGPLYVCPPSPSSTAYGTSKPAQKHFSLLPGTGNIPLPQQIRNLDEVVSPPTTSATFVVDTAPPPKISVSQHEHKTAQLQVTSWKRYCRCCFNYISYTCIINCTYVCHRPPHTLPFSFRAFVVRFFPLCKLLVIVRFLLLLVVVVWLLQNSLHPNQRALRVTTST